MIPARTSEKPDKRAAILHAALELFADRGFHGTAVPLIAEKAQVGAGTIYRYFESKEAIVNALYVHWKTELGSSLVQDLPAQASPREQFRHFWRQSARFSLAHPLAIKFLELHHHAPYLNDASRAIEVQVLAPAFAFLEHCRANDVTKRFSNELLGSLVWGAFVGMVKAAWEGRITLSAIVIDQAEQCCWEAIRA
jgi:AcrR family transcriptional regulator